MRKTLIVACILVIVLQTMSSSRSLDKGRILLVLHKFENFLGYYDVGTGKELGRVETGVFPHEMTLSPDRTKVFITEYGCRGVESEGQGSNTIAVVDLKARKRIGTISTEQYNRPHGIVARDGRLFVTSEPTQRLLIFDLQTERLVHAVNTEQLVSHLVNVSPDGKTAFTSNIRSNSLTAIDPVAGKVIKHIPLLVRPEGMVFSPDGRLLYVVNRESEAISIVDTGKLATIGEIPTGKGPVRIVVTPDGQRLAFPLFHADQVQIADTRTAKVTHTIPVGKQPAGTTISPDGELVFVSCELEKTVYVLSLKENQIVTKIGTGEGPDAMICMDATELR
jgi:YVTN family beta-propeller protein